VGEASLKTVALKKEKGLQLDLTVNEHPWTKVHGLFFTASRGSSHPHAEARGLHAVNKTHTCQNACLLPL